MIYNTIGNSTLRVSKIALGTMTWGEQNTRQEAFAQMDFALTHGVNFWDVAEMYPVPPKAETFGASESIMGEWLAARGGRERLVIASKVTGASHRNRGISYIRGGASLTYSQIEAACNDSLRRLQTDYLDLYQIHWPERATNFFGKLNYSHKPEEDGVALHETLEAASRLVAAGKVRYIGISNETAWGLMRYLQLAEQANNVRIISIQNPFNLLNRTAEINLSECCLRENIGFLAYSPLAFGKLSGKYLNGAKPDRARLTLFDRFTRYEKTNCNEATQAYAMLAQQIGVSPAKLALAYVNQHPLICSNIVGATTLAQLNENIASIDTKLDSETLDTIDEIHQRYPNPAP